MRSVLRPPAANDEPAIVALNDANVVATSPLTVERLHALIERAFRVRVAGGPGEVDAFLLAFDETASFESPNFAWFGKQYPRFVYIDRIVVAARARRSGLGRLFYEDLIRAAADAGHSVLGCEVNLDPPNPGSDAFHDSLQFLEVGRATLANGKTVRYLARKIP